MIEIKFEPLQCGYLKTTDPWIFVHAQFNTVQLEKNTVSNWLLTFEEEIYYRGKILINSFGSEITRDLLKYKNKI